VHFDLKSANILLSRDFTAKIADVGLAKIMQQQFLSTLYCIGTFAWAAPEVRQSAVMYMRILHQDEVCCIAEMCLALGMLSIFVCLDIYCFELL